MGQSNMDSPVNSNPVHFMEPLKYKLYIDTSPFTILVSLKSFARGSMVAPLNIFDVLREKSRDYR